MMVKVRRSVWVDSNLLLLLTDMGIDLSTFLSWILADFLEVPEDPNEKIIKLRVRSSTIRARNQYINELRDRSLELRDRIFIEDQERITREQAAAKLLDIGEALKSTSCWDQVSRDLQRKDPVDAVWDIVLAEMNARDGNRWDQKTLWDTALEWFKVYGKEAQAAAPR